MKKLLLFVCVLALLVSSAVYAQETERTSSADTGTEEGSEDLETTTEDTTLGSSDATDDDTLTREEQIEARRAAIDAQRAERQARVDTRAVARTATGSPVVESENGLAVTTRAEIDPARRPQIEENRLDTVKTRILVFLEKVTAKIDAYALRFENAGVEDTAVFDRYSSAFATLQEDVAAAEDLESLIVLRQKISSTWQSFQQDMVTVREERRAMFVSKQTERYDAAVAKIEALVARLTVANEELASDDVTLALTQVTDSLMAVDRALDAQEYAVAYDALKDTQSVLRDTVAVFKDARQAAVMDDDVSDELASADDDADTAGNVEDTETNDEVIA